MSMHKKGAGSVEFITAFVLFAGFTFAALYLFNPVQNLRTLDYAREFTISAITQNTSVELESYSVVITGSGLQIRLVEILKIDSSKNVHASDYYGEAVDSSRSGNDVCIDTSNIVEKILGRKFVELYFSEDIPYPASMADCSKWKNPITNEDRCDWCTPRNCPMCLKINPPPINGSVCGEVCGDGIDNDGIGGIDDFDKDGNACVGFDMCKGATEAYSPEGYEISSSSNEKIISEKRVKELARIYGIDQASYSQLKKDLSIPESVDFSFSLKFSEEEQITPKKIVSTSGEVYSEIKRIKVLRTDGATQFGELSISVW